MQIGTPKKKRFSRGHSVVPVATSSSSVSSVPHISSVTSQPAACVEVSRSIKTPIKAIINHSRPTVIISSENSEFLVPSLPPTPSNQMRAKELLAVGAMPLFPPARREWDQDEAVTFLEPNFKWPPSGWKEWSADLKLKHPEFQAMAILKAMGSRGRQWTPNQYLECSHTGDQTSDLQIIRWTPHPLHISNL
ncbi:hypothetical protein DPMN_194538 [Dreissena polymorpha]|uniref:Uncharacterized protein n=1 Tax=Dreissena polymorpha TaxID=45954 RepID=A0A9D4BEW9_DREPO|nr:hypothetical protein DPMN_194538 [Dreissena polymorpha]